MFHPKRTELSVNCMPISNRAGRLVMKAGDVDRHRSPNATQAGQLCARAVGAATATASDERCRPVAALLAEQ
ncbi:hypothetical protein COO20_25385 [Thalassospira marina]|uniref:Uncharacterized protein n=1 Tax=Thalassospira marina TaxID=2048283 RepID=A0A2N3KC21_9PROT|nr:hypothetical protein COO20_25385 [Thalassospira marina]